MFHTFALMQDKGHPEMIETTLDLRSPTDILPEAAAERRQRCRTAVTTGIQNCEVRQAESMISVPAIWLTDCILYQADADSREEERESDAHSEAKDSDRRR